MSAENKKRSPVFRILKAIGVLLLAVVVLFAGLLGFLSVTEYKPEDRTALSVEGTAGSLISEGDSLTIMTWNIGYGALGDNADFFMDGGKMVNTADKARVAENMNGIISTLNEYAPDILFLQIFVLDTEKLITDLFRRANIHQCPQQILLAFLIIRDIISGILIVLIQQIPNQPDSLFSVIH
jgi:hypothetical protein